MLESSSAGFSADYSVRNISTVSKALQGLPEFSRTRFSRDAEEFVWVVPVYPRAATVTDPVATVKLSSQSMRIECRSRHALRAMQVLFDSLVGSELELVSSATASAQV